MKRVCRVCYVVTFVLFAISLSSSPSDAAWGSAYGIPTRTPTKTPIPTKTPTPTSTPTFTPTSTPTPPYEALAQRFRPYLRFSYDVNSDETIRPCSWQWLVKHSRVEYIGGNVTGVFLLGLDNSDLSNNPDILLNGGYAPVTNLFQCTDVRQCPTDQSIGLIDRTDNDLYNVGQAWTDVQGGAGIYAHVEQVVDNPDLINIEYIVLFPYNHGLNDTGCWLLDEVYKQESGDHYGDLTFLTLVYSQACDQIIRATFSAHGQVLLSYDLTNDQNNIQAVQPPPTGWQPPHDITGRYNGNVPAQQVSVNNWYLDPGEGGIPTGGTHWCCSPWCLLETGGLFGCCECPDTRNFFELTPGDPSNYVYFVQDPDTHRFEHIAAFLEWGAHEMYPSAFGDAFCCPSHNGDGTSFLPTQVTYLGRLADARSNVPLYPRDAGYEDAPFIFFDGKWGDDPKPPIMHGSWYYPYHHPVHIQSPQCVPWGNPPSSDFNNPLCIPNDRFDDPSPYDIGLAWPPVAPGVTPACNLELEVPTALCQSVTVVAGANCTAPASIDNGSRCPGFASCGVTQAPPWPPQAPPRSYPLGSTNVTLTATNGVGATDQCSVTVTVVDKTAPTISNAAAVPNVLLPPTTASSMMDPVTINYDVADNCAPPVCQSNGCGAPVCHISSVVSNEPISNSDYSIVDAHHVLLRATRLGSSAVRIYTITITCADTSGNVASQAVGVRAYHSSAASGAVGVPH